MQFRDVKMPTYDKGYLIIHSDHAYTSTFKTWLPLIQKYDRMHNQWIDSKAVNFGVAVNTAPVGSSGYLTPVELKKMYDAGVEILSHNRYHISIGALPITEQAEEGATTLRVAATKRMGLRALRDEAGYGTYSYELIDGDNKEVFYLSGYTSTTLSLASPLSRTFPKGSILKPTQETIEDLVLGCLDDLAGWGIDDVPGYVYPDHSASYYDPWEPSIDYIKSVHKAARGGYGETNNLNSVNWGNLQGFALRPGGMPAYSTIDRILEETSQDNLIAIVWSHGETEQGVLDRLEYLVKNALRKGIRVITQKQAYQMFS